MNQAYNFCANCNGHVTPRERDTGEFECPTCETIINQHPRNQEKPRERRERRQWRKQPPDKEFVRSWADIARAAVDAAPEIKPFEKRS